MQLFRSDCTTELSFIPSQFYGAPTAIRLLLRYDSDFVKRYDRSSLRTLASVGEPINHEAWHWFNDVVGDGRWVTVGGWGTWGSRFGNYALSAVHYHVYKMQNPEPVIRTQNYSTRCGACPRYSTTRLK